MTDYRMHEQQLSGWWQTPLAQSLLQDEAEAVQALKHYLHGYYQCQLGGARLLLPSSSRPEARFWLGMHGDLQCRPEAMPFKSHTVDSLLLQHVLEFSSDPHQLLREAERVLVADGTLVLCCFNPFSAWGLRHLFSWRDQPPWTGHFFSRARITDWLALLNFQIVESRPLAFRLPVQSESWLKRSRFIERWGRRLWPPLCGVTVLVASKRTVPLTPLPIRWRKPALLPKTRLVNKPLTRDEP